MIFYYRRAYAGGEALEAMRQRAAQRARMLKKVFFIFVYRDSLTSESSLDLLRDKFEEQEQVLVKEQERMDKIKGMVVRRYERY